MTETDDREVQKALRAMLSDRIGALAPPAGVYEAVRRRHRRRQRAIVGSALVLAVAAVAVPSVALAQRPTTPPATERPRCTFEGDKAVPVTDRLPAQRDVAGSLGGNSTLVTAVLSAGWSAMRADAAGTLLDPATARVQMVQEVEGQVVALVSASGLGRRLLEDTWVWGPDADNLVMWPAGGGRAPTPVRTRFELGDVLLQGIEVCGSRYVAVVAPPGTTGRATWISAITPELRAERSTLAVPMRADGIAMFRSDAPDVRITLEHAGRVLWNRGLPSDLLSGMRPAEEDLARAAADAPGDGSPALVRSIVDMTLGVSDLPVRQSDQRVLWSGRAGRATVVVATCMLPGGVRYVTADSAVTVNTLSGPGYAGLLEPGALERTVLAWRLDAQGRSVAVFAVGGVRAEALLSNGDVARFALSGGGGVLRSGTPVRHVRVYAADNHLIGEQTPGRGLTPVPHENPV